MLFKYKVVNVKWVIAFYFHKQVLIWASVNDELYFCFPNFNISEFNPFIKILKLIWYFELKKQKRIQNWLYAISAFVFMPVDYMS